MKPVRLLDSLAHRFPGLPVCDLSDSGNVITPVRDRYDRRQVRAPFSKMIVGMALEPLAFALQLNPYPAILESAGIFAHEVGFVVSDQGRLTAEPFIIRRDGDLGDANRVVVVNSGVIEPDPPVTDLTFFDALWGRWFAVVLDAFYLLQDCKGTLQDVSFEVSRAERRRRARKGMPSSYLVVRPNTGERLQHETFQTKSEDR